MPTKDYDLGIIGGGAGGLVAAVAAGALGARTVLLELEHRLGGECSWTGCVPSKALIAAAALAYRSGRRFPDVMEHVGRTVLEASKSSKISRLLEQYGVDVRYGRDRKSVV